MNILQNSVVDIPAQIDSLYSGWVVNGNVATHSACNPGTMTSANDMGLVDGETYVVTYIITNYISGGVNIELGTTSGGTQTANGTITEQLVYNAATGIPQISFFADGAVTVSILSIFDMADETGTGVTIAFFDGDNNDKRWVTNYSFQPELMIRFINSFFIVVDGQLWQQNVNPVRNNFCGQQYVSQIQFYDNLDPTTLKLYYSMRTTSNTRWFCPNNGDISILPVVGRSLGMSSRLKRNNFKNYQGSFFADFMRNYLDSRFDDPETALFKGEPLRGRFMEITVTNDDTTEAVLFEIDVKSATSNITY